MPVKYLFAVSMSAARDMRSAAGRSSEEGGAHGHLIYFFAAFSSRITSCSISRDLHAANLQAQRERAVYQHDHRPRSTNGMYLSNT